MRAQLLHHARDAGDVVVGGADEGEHILHRVLPQDPHPGVDTRQLLEDDVIGGPLLVQLAQVGVQLEVVPQLRLGVPGVSVRVGRQPVQLLLVLGEQQQLGPQHPGEHGARARRRRPARARLQQPPAETLSALQRDVQPQLRAEAREVFPHCTLHLHIM